MRKKRLAEYVIEDIKAMLLDGRLKEGDKLPNQNEFAKQLGISRLTLREALRTLEILGVVQQRPKTGTVIIDGDLERWEYSASSITLKDEEDTQKMILARSCIEPTIAAESLKYITTEQVERLTRIFYEMHDAYRVSDVEGYLAKDKEFHLFIAEASENKYLMGMYEVALSQVDIFMKEVFIALPEAFEKTMKIHRAIYESLAEKKPEKLLKSVNQHSVYIEELIQKFFAKKKLPELPGLLYYP